MVEFVSAGRWGPTGPVPALVLERGGFLEASIQEHRGSALWDGAGGVGGSK